METAIEKCKAAEEVVEHLDNFGHFGLGLICRILQACTCTVNEFRNIEQPVVHSNYSTWQ